MGLLDDAIREHLELKRLREADPGEVARAEQDALGSMRRRAGSGSEDQADSQAEGSITAVGSFFLEPTPASGADAPASSHGNQETVEINMEAELEHSIDIDHESEALNDVFVAPVGYSAYTQENREEPTESETSSGRAGDRGEITAPDGDLEPGPTYDPARDEHIEDVTDETPNSAPDGSKRKRLWFKRRARRDFDFDE